MTQGEKLASESESDPDDLRDAKLDRQRDTDALIEGFRHGIPPAHDEPVDW